jgi:hypothetical protein
MNAAITALVVGTALAIGALAFVLYPLFFEQRVSHTTPTRRIESWSDDVAIAALREIEFDRVTGKLSDGDYAQLKEQYTRQALARMRRAPAIGSDEDDLEATIRAYRAERPACDRCGPRPEADAIFCSHCGQYLPGRCEECGQRVEEAGARFCSACGHKLAA